MNYADGIPEAGPLILLLAGIGAVVLGGYGLVRLIQLVVRWRGTRVVRCPETCNYVAVKVDAAHAAASGVIREPELRLNSCTRWPEKKDCGQECLAQIDAAPEDCLVRNVAVHWYMGKQCVFCGRDLSEFHWPDYRCALRLTDGKTLEWKDVSPEKLPGVLDQALPVCWNCHVAETFRREHPELVTDRPGGVVGPLGERSDTPVHSE